jgi:preprotein translocase SecE subunit
MELTREGTYDSITFVTGAKDPCFLFVDFFVPSGENAGNRAKSTDSGGFRRSKERFIMAAIEPTTNNVPVSKSGTGIVEYLQGVRAELKKAEWPSREELIRLTQVVLFLLFVTALFCGALDGILSVITHNLFTRK